MNWKEKIKKISPALLEDIAKKLGFNKTSEELLNMWDIEQAEKKYQNFVIDRCKMLYVLGANQASELGSIFTHIHVIQDKDRFRFQDPNSIPEGNPQESIKGIDYIQNEKNQNKNFFIMGGPGAGKTTFLKWMATAAAKKEQGFTKTPIFLELRAWADSQKDLQTYIAEELFKPQGMPDADTFVEKILLQEGNAILFLDGLDEIRTENNQRGRVIKSIVEFQQKYHTNRFFLTCRNYATEYSFTAFEYIHISPFNEEQIQTFIRRWFHDKVPTAQDILQKIQQKEHTDIRELVSLPVFLSMFCLYYENVGSVPADRSELYDKAFQGLLVKIDAQNNRKRDDFYTSFTPTNREKLYYQLAYNTFNSKNQRFSKETVIETIQEFYGTLPEDKKAKDFDANKVFQMMAEQHGIIAEKLKDEFGFSHLTLQEYAVAKYLNGLADTPLRETILENITDTRWRNVFTYTVQIMSENKTPIFFNAFVTKMKTLILAPDSQTLQIWKWISKRKPNPKKDYKLFYLLYEKIFFTQNIDRDLYTGLCIDRDIHREINIDGQIDIDIDLNLNRDLDMNLDRDLNLDLDMNLDRDLNLDIDRYVDIDLDRRKIFLESYWFYRVVFYAFLASKIVKTKAEIRDQTKEKLVDFIKKSMQTLHATNKENPVWTKLQEYAAFRFFDTWEEQWEYAHTLFQAAKTIWNPPENLYHIHIIHPDTKATLSLYFRMEQFYRECLGKVQMQKKEKQTWEDMIYTFGEEEEEGSAVFVKAISLSHFKYFKKMDIQELKQVNLLIGENNCGKSTLLEGLYFSALVSDADLIPKMYLLRNMKIQSADEYKYFFHNMDTTIKPKMVLQFRDETMREVELSPLYAEERIYSKKKGELQGIDIHLSIKKGTAENNYSCKHAWKDNKVSFSETENVYEERFSASYNSYRTYSEKEMDEKYSDIMKESQEHTVVEKLKEFYPQIQNLVLLTDGLYVKHKDYTEKIPIQLLGDGVKHFLNLLIDFVSSQNNNIILIDEIESGMHYSAHKLLWKNILFFAKNMKVQFFITTHSKETIQYLQEVLATKEFADMQSETVVYNLIQEKSNGEGMALRWQYEDFKDALEYDNEIR